MFGELNNNRLEYENKQLKLQLETTMDQVRKFKELSGDYKKAYDGLSKKVTSFCSCITSLAYAKKQIGGKNKLNNMSIDDLLAFSVDEYNKQKKEFENIINELTSKMDDQERKIKDLEAQISVMELEMSQPSHITNSIDGGEAYVPEVPSGLGLPDIAPIPVSPMEDEDGNMTLSLDDDFDAGVKMPEIPNIPDDISMPPIPSIPDDIDMGSNNTSNDKSSKKQAPVVVSKKAKSFNGPKIEDDDIENELPVDSQSKIQIARQDLDSIPNMNTPNFEAVNPENVVTDDIRKSLREKQQKEKEQKMHMMDIAPLIEGVKQNQISMSIFRLIGEQGYSQLPQIKELLSSSSIEKGAKTSVMTQINALAQSKLISRENMVTGYRRFIVCDFTPLGRRVFEEIFKKSPVETEVRRLTRENASAEHGYLIQDTMTILQKEFGYKQLCIDRKQNTMELRNGKKYIPDIKATFNGTNWDYIEIERGTHTQKDFNEKLDKMLMVTRTFHFVSQNQEMLDKVIEKTNKWVEERGIENLKKIGLTIKFSTITHLSKRNWSKIISFEK